MDMIELESGLLVSRPQFTANNDKLGRDGLIYCFNLPAPKTCRPSPVCLEMVGGRLRCYVLRGRFSMWASLYENNLRWAMSEKFVAAAIDEIWRLGIAVLRWHDAGDFFNVAYVKAVREIVRATYHTAHYTYTRRGADRDFRPALIDLASEPNFHMWESFDHRMAIPERAENIDLCYLSVSDTDEPPCRVELVWRDLAVKHTTERTHTANGSPVCPYEDGTGQQITCSLCQRCWSRCRTGRH